MNHTNRTHFELRGPARPSHQRGLQQPASVPDPHREQGGHPLSPGGEAEPCDNPEADLSREERIGECCQPHRDHTGHSNGSSRQQRQPSSGQSRQQREERWCRKHVARPRRVTTPRVPPLRRYQQNNENDYRHDKTFSPQIAPMHHHDHAHQTDDE